MPMSDKAFFDTTILIYSIYSGDARTTKAEDLLTAGGSISVQVLNEFASVARRKLAMTWSEIEDALSAIRTLCKPALPLTIETHIAALGIAARYGYHVYDSLILAAALESGCNTLYSEDMQHGQVIESLTIRNPFLA